MKRYRRPRRAGKTKERPKAFAGEQRRDVDQRFIGEFQLTMGPLFL
jgi:hypothetical protein